jgi:hypothetical protein
MLSRSLLGLIAAVTLGGATAAPSRGAHTLPGLNVLRVTSGTPGHEVRVRGVLLLAGQPMRLVEQSTPFEFRSDGELAFAAFEPVGMTATLTLELVSSVPEPAMVTAPRVMVGRRIGGVASEFVQGY